MKNLGKPKIEKLREPQLSLFFVCYHRQTDLSDTDDGLRKWDIWKQGRRKLSGMHYECAGETDW